MISIMNINKKILNVIYKVLAVMLALILWEIAALKIDSPILLVTPVRFLADYLLYGMNRILQELCGLQCIILSVDFSQDYCVELYVQCLHIYVSLLNIFCGRGWLQLRQYLLRLLWLYVLYGYGKEPVGVHCIFNSCACYIPEYTDRS